MKYIAICLHEGTPPKRNAITNLAKEKEWPCWHWIDDLWIVGVSAETTPKSISALVERIPEVGTSTILLFEVQTPFKYWGRTNLKSWEWLKENAGGPG